MNYVIYDSLTGRIKQKGFSMQEQSVPIGATLFEVIDRDYLGIDVPNLRFDIESNALVSLPARPSENHQFDYASKQWIDPRTLQSRIDLVHTTIKAERDKRKDGGTLVSGNWFHSDGPSRIQQLGLVMMGVNVPAVQWKTMAGNYVTMTQALAMGIFQATAQLDMTLFANCEAHLAAVSVSTDPEAYDFSTGWPEHFQA